MKNKEIKLSLELQILIESINLVLLNKPLGCFANLVNLPEVNWDRLQKMVVYHQIRPIFFEACRMSGIGNKVISILEIFSKKQTIKNLVFKNELIRILDLLRNNNIEVLPYKGILFLEILYKNQPIREFTDMDLIVKPSQAIEALSVLINDGYKLSIEDKNDSSLLNETVERTQSREIGLDKAASTGINIHIDFHWGLNESYHRYNVYLDEMIEQSDLKDWGQCKLLTPNSKTIFKMLLNHHGGRGCWLRLKDFCDLIAYKKQFSEYDTHVLANWAAEMKMKRAFMVGNSLVENLFLSNNEETQITDRIQHKIISFWEQSLRFDKLLPKISYNNIYRLLQDKPLSVLNYASRLVKFHAIPHKAERKRLVVFPDKYVYLNATSKLFSYIWYRILIKFDRNLH